MLKLALAAIAAGLIGADAAQAQEVPPPAGAPAPINPRDPYPNPPPPEDVKQDQVQPAKPKITGGLVAEAGGGVVGGLLAKGVGTAVAGPVGGFAASWVGSSLGGKAVHVVRRMLHHDKPEAPQEQAKADPAQGGDAAATAPAREPDAPN